MKTVSLLALIAPASGAGTSIALKNKGLNPVASWFGNLKECQGDCDNNGHCKGNLKCFQRNGKHPVPGCHGSGNRNWDYCYDPVKQAQRVQMQHDYTALRDYGHTPAGSILGKCVGDCDLDGHCKGGLKCFKRSGNEKVPGCAGSGSWGYDFCYDPADKLKDEMAQDFSALRDYGHTPAGNILGKCVGDCDHNGHCRGGLLCMQRYADEKVPGCAGSGKRAYDFCYDPMDKAKEDMARDYTTLQNFGWTPAGNTLGKCVGDCDNNGHCKGGLKCWDRKTDELVPGCSGTSMSDLDYCYDPADLAADHSTLTNYGWTPAGAPMGKCVGDCDHNGHCTGDLVCQQRQGSEPVHGCSGSAEDEVDYCVEFQTTSPTTSPTRSPTERCDANNCMHWDCVDWCECYDESKLDLYNRHEECQDDGDDSCICFDNKEHEEYGERHRKINYNQDAVDAGTAMKITGTDVHSATKQNHYQEAGVTTEAVVTAPPTTAPPTTAAPTLQAPLKVLALSNGDTLKRFSNTHLDLTGGHRPAYRTQKNFCAAQGGRLPTFEEICPNGERNMPAMGCVPAADHSWVPYSKNDDSYIYISCDGHGGIVCKDHVTYHGNPNWGNYGDVYGKNVECIIPGGYPHCPSMNLPIIDTQCFGLEELKEAGNMKQCELECCKKDSCQTWNYHENHGCWVGHQACKHTGVTQRSDGAWVGTNKGWHGYSSKYGYNMYH
jgi:hypothetical protein